MSLKNFFPGLLFVLGVSLTGCLQPFCDTHPDKCAEDTDVADTDTDTDTDSDTDPPVDADGDTYSVLVDCNDDDASVHPGAIEVPDDGVDQDCSGADLVTVDSDEDGYKADVDCNDLDAAVHPGAAEECNNRDDNCDDNVDEGIKVDYYFDNDGDGYGNDAVTEETCSPKAKYILTKGDCDDADAEIHPGAVETCDDTEDKNCDGTFGDDDADHDGYRACKDCNDAVASIHPGAIESCNTLDDDCDTLTDEGLTTTFYRDADGDTYGTSASTMDACTVPSGYAESSTDCDDANGAIHPGVKETCNEVDDDCDGAIDIGATDRIQVCYDSDCDGVTGRDDWKACEWQVAEATALGECYELVDLSWDDDGSGPRCHLNPEMDCDDEDATIYWGATETPGDGIDSNCNDDDDT
jgi:hypothetical protein